MSEYLKWYDSYVDHTPTEDLAKNELESAHRKIKHLTESLAKANELVKELEHGNRACAIAIRELIKRGDIKPLMVGNDALDKIVNKFAIEKKREGYYNSCIESGMNGGQADLLSDIYAEQLRKEQE